MQQEGLADIIRKQILIIYFKCAFGLAAQTDERTSMNSVMEIFTIVLEHVFIIYYLSWQ